MAENDEPRPDDIQTVTRGWYDMACWNGLSAEQHEMLIKQGVLPWGRWEPEGGPCTNGAAVAVECEGDESPGPRFYCRPCAIDHIRAGIH